MFETLTLSQDARGIARLTLNRPARHNALSAQMIAELTEAAARLASAPEVRVVVLAAEGESFCAGGDLAWMKEQIEGGADARRTGAKALAGMLNALNTLPKPLIGRVQGPAYGGGLGLMSVCDACIGVDHARFGLTEVKLGLIPATISPYVVARIGPAAARRHFMSARLFDAEEAARIDLLAEVVPADALDATIEAHARSYLGCAPGAVAASKALVARLSTVLDASLLEETVDLLIARWEDPEATEGIAAFLEKRKPGWVA